MSAKTKIIVLHMKEVIYTGIFLLLAVILAIVLFFMFGSGQNNIQSIELVNLSESTAAMFPLMEPALESLASQIYTSQSLENIQYSEDQKYTSMILLNAIETALKKAENN